MDSEIGILINPTPYHEVASLFVFPIKKTVQLQPITGCESGRRFPQVGRRGREKAFWPISPHFYCILIRNLIEENRLLQETGLVQALAYDHSATPIPDLCRSFVQGCRDLDSKPTLIGLLIEWLTRVGRIQGEESHGFGLMIKYGMAPTSLGSWNDLLHALDRLNCTALVWNLFTQMTIANSFTFNIVLHALCKEGKLEKALDLATEMEAKGYGPNVVSYNMLIWGFFTHGHVEFGMKLIEKMPDKGCHPNVITYNILLKGCCQQGMLEWAISVWQQMVKRGLVQNDFSFNILIDGHCKEGDIQEAFRLQDNMPRLGVSPDLVTFNTLLNGFCIRGEIQEAQDLLVQMLNSCSPGGKIPKAEVVQDNHVSSVDSSALVTETEVGELLSMELL